MTGAGTLTGRNLRREPWAILSVDDDAPPFAYVRCDGRAAVSEHLEEMLGWSIRVAGRHMGAAPAESYGRRNAVPGELLLRLTPGRIATEVGVADPRTPASGERVHRRPSARRSPTAMRPDPPSPRS